MTGRLRCYRTPPCCKAQIGNDPRGHPKRLLTICDSRYREGGRCLMRSWTRRQWGVALLGAALTVLLIGIPTGVVPTDLYSRMTPVLWWNYPVLAVTAVLEGLLLATYVAPIRPAANQGSKAFVGGLVSLFAVG